MSVTIGPNGAIPTPPATLLANLLAAVAATNPGYTADLPALLIEDIASTSVGALTTIDQAKVDSINSITPYGANPFIINQLGAQSGIAQGIPSNTSVYVVFTGTAGYFIPVGFQVSDGTYTYQIQDGGSIETGGTSQSLYAVATISGSWAVPANTVTSLATSVPSGYITSVTNPLSGIPGQAAESTQSYQARVIQAQTVTAQGTPGFLTTQLNKIAGAIPRLIRVLQVTGGWEVICGGGDPYSIAGAIYQSVLDLTTIVGSTTTARNVTTTVIDSANTFNVVFVNPPMQTVTVAATWNTTLPNFNNGPQVNSLATPALQTYINSIYAGQPINLLMLNDAFVQAVSSVIEEIYVTTLTFVVTINGTTAGPTAGTNIIPSDPESYFYCALSGVTVTQG